MTTGRINQGASCSVTRKGVTRERARRLVASPFSRARVRCRNTDARHARMCAILFAAGLAQPVGDTLLCLTLCKAIRENDGVLASKTPSPPLFLFLLLLSPFVRHKNISQDQNTRVLILPNVMMRGLEETARFTLTLDRRWRCLDVEDCSVWFVRV